MELRHLRRVACLWLIVGLFTIGCNTESNVTSTSLSISPTMTVTSTMSSSHAASSSSKIVTTSTQSPEPPTPTPKPGVDFLSFKDEHLYIKIHNISITFNSVDYPTLTGESIASKRFLNDTISPVTPGKQDFVYKRFYGTEKNPTFYIAFFFKLNPSEDNPTWYMSNFQHKELVGDEEQRFLFQYKGIELSIYAPSDLTYHCNTVELHGSGGVEDVVTTSVNFTVLQVQPFLNKQDPSDRYFDCAHHSSNNDTIGLAVGLSIGVLVLIAIIAIIASLIVSRKYSNRGYDILKD